MTKFYTYCAFLVAIAALFCTTTALCEEIAVIAPNSCKATLTESQVKDLFLGKRKSSPCGDRLLLIDQGKTSQIKRDFYAKIAGKTPRQMMAHWSKLVFTGKGKAPRRARSDAAVKHLINEIDNGIGYIRKSSVDSSINVLCIINIPEN